MSLDNKIYLELPEDETRISKLKRKAKEYEKRVEDYRKKIEEKEPYQHPGLIEIQLKKSQDYMNFTILSKLLSVKRLETNSFSLELNKKGLIIDKESLERYNQACAIIDDYCKTGGTNAQNGTRLK
jgi:uridine kinase